MSKLKLLSNNQLKIIAAALMLIDHIGMWLIPQPYEIYFRIIGRLSFPIFAFLIAEGAKHTKDKKKYFLTVLGVGALCQIPSFVIFNDYSFNILFTFAFSIGIIYALDFFKSCLFDNKKSIWLKIGSGLLFLLSVFVIYFIERAIVGVNVSYGFFGVMTAVFASAPNLKGINAPAWLKKLDNLPIRLICMAIPLVLLSRASGWGIQTLGLLSLPILLL